MYKDMWKKLFTVLIQWCFLSDLSHHLYDIDVVWSYISAMKIMHNIYIYTMKFCLLKNPITVLNTWFTMYYYADTFFQCTLAWKLTPIVHFSS